MDSFLEGAVRCGPAIPKKALIKGNKKQVAGITASTIEASPIEHGGATAAGRSTACGATTQPATAAPKGKIVSAAAAEPPLTSAGTDPIFGAGRGRFSRDQPGVAGAVSALHPPLFDMTNHDSNGDASSEQVGFNTQN